MKLTFLEAAGGTRLSKTVLAEGSRSYPNVKNVTSHEVPITKGSIKEVETALRYFSDKGMCLLKGPLRGPLKNESRRGATDNVAYADYLVIDLDNALLPAFKLPSKITKSDVARAAEQVVALLPDVFKDVSYIAQASSSLGLKGEKVSMHIYFLLKTPLPPKTLKLWLRHINLEIAAFAGQLELTASGSAMRYVVDPSVADNSKLIFIAPPVFEGREDPFISAHDRIVLVERKETMVELGPLFNAINPEALNKQINERKDQLRLAQGLPKKKAKITVVSHGDQQIELITNPDRVTISVIDESNYPYVRCNINGGDSGAYWFNVEDPAFMFNFKDEPAFEIEKADPEFYISLFERYADRGMEQKRPLRPVVMRDFFTDTYWNGVYDPNSGEFTHNYPLTVTSKGSVESFMKSHGRPEPSYIPDAKVVFDPSKMDEPCQLETPPYYVNMYTRSPYMINAKEAPRKLEYGTAIQIQEFCPTIFKIIYHMLGSSAPEYEHFINWLAYIYQTKTKSMTAWVLTGVPGTGKGLFVNQILKPLFGDIHVAMRSMENIEEQFNLYMRAAMFLVVDEFRMMDARLGTTRIADKLKSMITEPTLTIRGMRANQLELPSYTNFMFLTNRPDAVKIDAGDRRYNVAPRQETKILERHPTLVDELPNIPKELYIFAAILQEFQVNSQRARTCLGNNAKATMRSITMTIHEEFLDSFKSGSLEYFADVLDIQTTNTFEAGAISSAKMIIRTWLMEAKAQGWSVVSAEQLRVVYLAYAQPQPAPSPREFSKMCQRAGLEAERKRPGVIAGTQNPVRGFVIEWTTEDSMLDALVQDYLDAGDMKTIRNAS